VRFVTALPFSVIVFGLLFSDSVGAQQSNSGQSLPLHVVYGQFFEHVEFLDAQADIKDSQGLPGQELRGYYRTMTGLSASDMATVKSIAAMTNAAVRSLDEEAMEIIAEARARYPGGLLPNRDALTKPPAKLAQLQQERDRMIEINVQTLRHALGEEAFQQLDGYVQSKFAPQIRRTPLLPVVLPDPERHTPNPPFKEDLENGGAL